MTALLPAILLGIAPATAPATAQTAGTPPAHASATTPESPVASSGEEREADITLRYGTDGRIRSAKVTRPGAGYVKVHFSAFRLLPGDRVTVADPAGREVHTYYGDPTRGGNAGGSGHTEHGGPGFAALSIDGDTAVVTLHARTARRDAGRLAREGYGVRVDRFWRGFTADEAAARSRALTVCGTDARRDVVCYRDSHPIEYARANAVGQQLLNGLGSCTVWKVGNTNRLLTNNHCMENAADLRASEFKFGNDCATCGGNDPRPGTKVGPGEFLKTSGLNALDYTLFSVADPAAIQQYGTLYIEPREPIAGERIYIPGHGDIKPKRLSLYEDDQGGATCKIDIVSSGVNTGYRCDSSGGNSGSPVLSASSHKVIALHHLGGCPNWGTRITLVYNEIAALIDNTPPTGGDDFSVAVSPSSGSTAPGGVLTASVSTVTTGGQPQNLTLSVSGLPAGASASLNPATVRSGASSTLAISTGAQTPPGTYPLTVSAAGSTGTRTTGYTLSVGSTSVCPGYETTKTGTISTQEQYQPDGRYYQTTVSGPHRACLKGPATGDFDLYLQKWNGATWAVVARSTTPSSDENLTYTGSAGIYRYRIHAYSGTGSYTLGYDAP
ncbi:serine protease [Spongiactinospora sp. TRM90649]|nr:serine protease [Spongiactinospora sp. TRM90649]